MKRANLIRRLGCSDSSPKRWSLALAIAAVLVIGCVFATQASAAKAGGILRIGGERDVNDLDPHTTRVGWDINIMQNVYSGLVKAGTDIQPRPDLATSWDFKTTTRLEFTLRQGVKFHNGREFTSADAKYSLERILDPKVPAGYASTIASIDSIETPSKYMLVLNLKRPDAAIVTNLSLPAMAMVAKETVKPMPVGLKDGMMGTGPYMFKEQIKGRRLVLVKNPNYYDKSVPLLDELHFIPLVDQTARTNALRAGQVDYIEPLPPKDVNALKRDSKINVTGGPNISFVNISLNVSKKPLNDVRVRQALAYAIDRKEMVEKGFDGFAQPLWGPPLIPPYWAGNSDRYYKLDREKAKQLLAEAGYPERGRSHHPTSAPAPTTRRSRQWCNPSSRRSASGSRSRRRTAPAASQRNWQTGNFQMYPIRWWGSDFVDPDGALTPLFTCEGSYNNSQLLRSGIRQAACQGRGSHHHRGTARKPIGSAMKRLAEQQPWVFLVAFDRFQAMRTYVKGYTAFPNASQYSLREVWLDK